MNRGKLTTYVLSLLFLAVLLSCFFWVKVDNAIYLAVIVPVFALTITWLVKGRSILSINKRQVLIILFISALLFVMLYYLMGIHFGFYRSSRTFLQIVKKVLPIVAVIIGVETIRSRLIIQKSKWIKGITFLCCVVAEVTLSINFNSFASFNKFMDFVGLNLFPAIVCNLLFCYVVVRYGALPNIAYGLITSLLPVFIPFTPAISDALYSLMKLLFPVLVYFFIKLLYEKKRRERKRISKKVGVASICVLLAFMSSIIVLISCQFHFCAIVIATESMTGELNKGDLIVYEKYTEEDVIEEGQVIVFNKFGATTVHRVIEIEHVNGQTFYYTKGDANNDADAGYITDSDIYGFVHFKVPYVGYPTLLLRAIFK